METRKVNSVSIYIVKKLTILELQVRIGYLSSENSGLEYCESAENIDVQALFLIESSVVKSWHWIVNVINMSYFENYKDITGNEDIMLRI